MHDLRERLVDRPQLSTDGLAVYQDAVEGAFGGDVDFAQVIKANGKEPGEDNERRYSPLVCTGIAKRRIEGNPDMRKANTPYVERHNLSMRMGMVSLYALHYNFCRIHKTLRVTPTMESGLTDTVHDLEWIVALIDPRAPTPKRPGPKPGTRYAKRGKPN